MLPHFIFEKTRHFPPVSEPSICDSSHSIKSKSQQDGKTIDKGKEDKTYAYILFSYFEYRNFLNLTRIHLNGVQSVQSMTIWCIGMPWLLDRYVSIIPLMIKEELNMHIQIGKYSICRRCLQHRYSISHGISLQSSQDKILDTCLSSQCEIRFRRNLCRPYWRKLGTYIECLVLFKCN